MEITTTLTAGVGEIGVAGRLDAYWADHLTKAIDEILHGGTHHLRLDMSEVVYISSAGVRVLLHFRKQAQRLSGSFVVVEPSPAVRSILEMAGLLNLLGEIAASDVAVEGQRFEAAGMRFQTFDLDAGAALRCRLLGDPRKLQQGGYRLDDCRTLATGVSTLALGVGAFGTSYADCRGRFGEFLAVAGAATYLPTDGTNRCDYLLSRGTFVPSLQVLYAIACEGSFRKLIRFEAEGDAAAPTLNNIVAGCVGDDYDGPSAVVIIAESAGLMGAALRRSPDEGAAVRCDMPAVRGWFSFTPERVHRMGLALLVGVVAPSPSLLDPFLRPLGTTSGRSAHLHAAAFPYRPLRKGRIELQESVQSLFEIDSVQSVLHLLNDDREIVGGGQSVFVRGACWVGPIAGIERPGGLR
ncbi:MAG: STAS domain-containing protein [Deltaproteobacteria bacterium]|nr:STAS domain-containing protein [Deltaproteobacteria bacterium]